MIESLLTMGLIFGVGSQPSSERGQTYFEIPKLEAGLIATNEDQDRFHLLVHGTDNRDSVTKKNQIELFKAYAEVHSPFDQNFSVEGGLVPNPWLEAQNRIWNFSYWGNDSEVALKRYKYLSSADLGLNAIWKMNSESVFILSLVNGEGNSKSESGPRKEATAILALENENWQGALGYVRGAYDDFDPSVNLKERTLLRISYLGSESSFSLEFFEAKDPSLALTQNGMADSLDLPTSPIETIKAQGASLLVSWKWSDYWTLKARYDALNPAVGYSLRAMTSGALALVNRLSKSMDQGFVFSRTDYQENHSLQAEIREKVLWSFTYHY